VRSAELPAPPPGGGLARVGSILRRSPPEPRKPRKKKRTPCSIVSIPLAARSGLASARVTGGASAAVPGLTSRSEISGGARGNATHPSPALSSSSGLFVQAAAKARVFVPGLCSRSRVAPVAVTVIDGRLRAQIFFAAIDA
jgi:hypothetical protein